MKPNQRWHELVAKHQLGEISDEEFTELESILRESPEARELYHRACRIDTRLRREAGANGEESRPAERKIITPRFRQVTWIAAAAAVVLAAFLFWPRRSQPEIIAELVSSEDAAWESSLPTEPGSRLTKGHLKLSTGIATIRFVSGAEMVLEAPAKLTLKTPMRAKLVSGAAIMNVPESAMGFVLETPDGYAVDYGTSFAVNVAGQENQSTFEVIEGEISVHVPSTGEEVRLGEHQAASIAGQTLSSFEGPLPEKEPGQPAHVIRIETNGRATSVIRNNNPKWLRPDMLMVRRRQNKEGGHDRRAFFCFDLSAVDLESINSVRLRLNQVPSGIGYATRLPKISRIGVYGLTNQAKSEWTVGCTWEEGPAPEDGIRLGAIEIPRSRQRGTHVFENEALLEFLTANRDGPVTFLLDRETPQVKGNVPALVHAFAQDGHPEAPGPILEFTLKDQS